MTEKDIRHDLTDIRYYYTHKEMFDKAGTAIVKSMIVEKAGRYNETIKLADPMLYALYVSLYTEKSTQKEVAQRWQVTEGYIKYLNKKLVQYLYKKFNAGGKKK